MKKQVLISVSIFLFLAISTVFVVMYAKGYRFGFQTGKPEFLGTGLLVLTSIPDGAQVFINGHLTTATDNTINLPPGEYKIRIFKDGYFPWEKTLAIQKEIVSKADALLLPNAPTLQPLTSTGVSNPSLDPSKTKLAYTVASQSARKNGIYVLDMTSKPILTLQSASTQIEDDTFNTFSSSIPSWSPDGKQITATISSELQNQTTFLLSANRFNDAPQDITATLTTTAASWENDRNQILQSQLNSIKPLLNEYVSKNFNIIDWSLDETKILYLASNSASLPLFLNPRIIGADSTKENRFLEKDKIYVYDIKEDKNFKVLDSLANSHDQVMPIQWFPDSKHLVYTHDKKIDLIEYDGGNQTTIYAGPFTDTYVFPWPNATKIVILTNLGNPAITSNLYTIDLK